MSDASTYDHDVLILGGGLVGSALACALDGLGGGVGQVEASAPQAGAPGFDDRKLALARASLDALAALDVLPRLPTAPAPIRRIHVSRAGDFGSVRLDAADVGQEAFGGVVLARDLGHALESRLADCRALVRHRPARVLEVQPDPDGPRVRIARDGGERWLRTRLLVAADGRDSLARTAYGIDARVHDYGQQLVVCSLETERAPDGTAYERFTDEGPVALLPMSGGHYGAVCAVASADAARVLALADAGYADYFQQRFGWRAGRVRRVGARSAHPLVGSVAERIVAPRLVVMGNAAQTLHPVGAQGFNLGLRDALTLAELPAGDDPGAPARLQAYADARREDRERTIAFSDGLARATANPSPAMHVLRSLGLLALGNVPGLSGPLVAGAMGYRGHVPLLARGGR
jgi:2-octaprenyl-6-methoxyphenol hydroxylase